MIDEKLEDEVWITVVATGYGEQKPSRARARALREPLGEPRVDAQPRARAARASRSSVDVDVPEFMPRF